MVTEYLHLIFKRLLLTTDSTGTGIIRVIGLRAGLASSPGPSLRGRKGPVHTDCACARLYPKSGYIVYSRKTLCKLSIYNYVTFSNHTRVWPTKTRGERKAWVRAVDRQATSNTLTQELVRTRSQIFTRWAIVYEQYLLIIGGMRSRCVPGPFSRGLGTRLRAGSAQAALAPSSVLWSLHRTARTRKLRSHAYK